MASSSAPHSTAMRAAWMNLWITSDAVSPLNISALARLIMAFASE